MYFFPVGYGGRESGELLDLLVTSGVRAVDDGKPVRPAE
jgi:hypothetical protein